jgi:hypothetical protein
MKLKEALAAVYINPVQAKALEAFGYCIVPKESTKEMLAAALPCADADYTEQDKKIGAAASLLLTGARNIPQEGDAVYAAAGLARDYRMLIAARPTIED